MQSSHLPRALRASSVGEAPITPDVSVKALPRCACQRHG